MFLEILATIAVGALYIIIFGGLLLWLLNYMMDQLNGLTQFNFWEFMAVVVLAFFVGSLV
tara:strand:+ start:452 stop:631 length:180 start_codon:yes stop_codon:yes gene_type:complete